MNNTFSVPQGNRRMTVKHLATAGLMTGVICVLGPFALPIPVSPVPISLGTLGIYFAVTVLGRRLGTLSVAAYILLGLAGLPVFTGFTSGPGKLLGPTGGYIIGYLLLAWICGFSADKWSGRFLPALLGMCCGTCVLYLFGSLWLAWQASLSLGQAFLAGVVPYIPGDLCKLALGMALGRSLRSRLKAAGLL